MREDADGRARARAANTRSHTLTTAPIEPSAELARRFGCGFVEGDSCFSLSRGGAPLALVRLNAAEARLTVVPAETENGGLNDADYAGAVLEYALGHLAETGRLLDVSDPLPERLIDPIADQISGLPTRDDPIIRGRIQLGPLSGQIAHLGAVEAFKTDRYQVRLGMPNGGGDALLSFPGPESPAHERSIRVAPAATALIVGLDDLTTELAGYLRNLGLNVLVAEQASVKRRDRLTEMAERGFPLLDAADLDGIVAQLAEHAPLKLIVEGYSSDSVLDPEGNLESEATALEASSRAAVLALRERFGCPVLFKGQADAPIIDAPAGRYLHGSAQMHALDGTNGGGFRFLSPSESALISALLPVLAPESAARSSLGTREGSVEVNVDIVLPTTTPYGARNRHSPDDVAVKVARGAEQRLLAHLDRLDPALKERLRPVENPELQQRRPRALAIHQHFGPWNVHVILEVEIRGEGADGRPLSPAAYKERLAQAGDIRLIDFDDLGLDREVVLALDGTQFQNLVFQKLGKIYHFRPTATVVPLSDWAFKVVLLVPQAEGAALNETEAALALSGIAGDDPTLIKRLAEEALDLPRIDARVAETFPPRGVNGASRTPEQTRAVERATVEPQPATPPDLDGIPSNSVLDVTLSDDGHVMTTRPAAGLDWDDARQRVTYFAALLERVWSYTTNEGRIIRIVDQHERDLRRFLAGSPTDYTVDPEVPGIARAPFQLGKLAGTRLRLGSERVPEHDRLIQVDIYRRDDPSDTPKSATITIAADDAPLIAVPTTVQLVCGFGNIAGDVGVLERRLGYRVVAWNRSPNERAQHALENGIPLYEFDETLDKEGRPVVQTRQRESYARSGLPLAGMVRDLLDNGLVVGQTERGVPVKAYVHHILDGLFGSSRHPVTGKSTKNSEIYREMLFNPYDARGIPTIYNGYNTPEKVAAGRIFVHDAFRTGGVDPINHYDETDGRRKSIMCVSCNTTNITSVLLRLIAIPGLSDVAVRVLTNRKTCDPFVGEGKQTINYQGMAFDFNYHHWEDSKLFFDAVRDPATRERLGSLFAREVKHEGGEPEWAISTHATGQAGTEFHVGLVHVRGKLNGGPLDADAIKEAIASSGIENVQLVDFPGDRINSTQFLETLHRRIGIRNLYVQPCIVVQDASDVIIVFFTPHLYNVKPNNLVAALNRDGLVANTRAGLDAATAIVAGALGLPRQQAALRQYYPVRIPDPEPTGARSAPLQGVGTNSSIAFFEPGRAEGMALGDDTTRRALLGGKGAALAEMSSLEYDDPVSEKRAPIPVPPGYTITTEQGHRYFAEGRRLPDDLISAIDAAQARLEAATGKRFGDPENPLLVSVRSGAAISMPGMMDTILNVGLNDRVVAGLATQSGDAAFAWDSYQRFVEMYAEVVLGIDRAAHLRPLRERILAEHGLAEGAILSAEASEQLVNAYKKTVLKVTGHAVPDDPREQLLAAVTAVFDSSHSERAETYRKIHGIPSSVISAVNVVAMIFGNLGEDSATGVVFTRDPLTGEKALNGEFLTHAQGEDVVRGVRTGQKIAELANSSRPALREAYQRLAAISEALERHFRDALDLEFTIERGDLWLLQSRRLGGRTGRAALRVATDMVDEGLISQREAVTLFGDPKGLNELLAPIFDPRAEAEAQESGRLLTRGIAASVGAASGRMVVSSERAQELARQGERVILVRPETSPEDVGGLHSADGVLTARGGIVSHAAIVARGMGKAAVVGAADVVVDEVTRRAIFGERGVAEGEMISVNGTAGTVYLGALPTVASPIKQKVSGAPTDAEEEDLYRRFQRLLYWASEAKAMEIRANAETPKDLSVALALGAEGIGLARTEHAVLASDERRVAFSALILDISSEANRKALAVLEPPMEAEVEELFRLLQGKPATIRLYDPVPNEFLPRTPEEVGRIARFLDVAPEEIETRAEARAETNPMLGHRGVRLCVVEPAIAEMQVRATLRAAARVQRDGIAVRPEIQIPLVINRAEIEIVARMIRRAAEATLAELGIVIPYGIGVMVETPAAVRTADEFAPDLDFFSLGVNDLSQTVLAVSRDDTARFIGHYDRHGIIAGDPFRSIDRIVGSFIAESVERAKGANPEIFIFSAGDVGGDPPSVELFHDLGLDGVSAGPWLVPLGILSAAQANIKRPRESDRQTS